MIRRYVKRIAVAVVALLGVCSCSNRGISVVSYNVGVFTKSGENSTGMIASMLRSRKADFVGLCELDSCTVRTGRVSQLDELRESMPKGYQMVFAPAMPFQGGKYGVGILVSPRYPILKTGTFSLDRGDGSEPRALCVAYTDELIFAVTHLDYTKGTARYNQGVEVDSILRRISSETGKDVILCGDFNASPESDVIAMFDGNWQRISPERYSYPSDEPKVCIDYIFLLKGSKHRCAESGVVTDFAEGSAQDASDHLAMFATLVR